MVPIFNADGSRYFLIAGMPLSLPVETVSELPMLTVIRNRRGHIKRAVVRRPSNFTVTRKHSTCGRYGEDFEQHFPHGGKCWALHGVVGS